MPKSISQPLPPKLLRLSCDPNQFAFATTDDLPDLQGFVGQNRALTATHFGIDINRDGYNIFALGPAGVGKRSIIVALLEQEAAKKHPPKDICYVHNFKDARYPQVMLLEPGLGRSLEEDMQKLIDILRVAIPAIFESEAYGARIKEIQEETRRKQESAFTALEKVAEQQEIAIIRTPDGFVLAATKKGEVINTEDFEALPKEERSKKEAQMQELHEKLAIFFEQIPAWQKDQREKIKQAIQYFMLLQVGSVISDVRKKYDNHKEIVAYFKDVQQAILDNPIDFRRVKEGLSGLMGGVDETVFNRYRVNVLVDNKDLQGAPIIYEDMPTLANLVGRIDHISHFGALTTDFTLIRAGALQRANGGYLLLDALKLLSQPFAWEGLKRMLRAKEVRIENFYQLLGYASTITIEPHPVALDVKVVLFGDRYIYYLLCALDQEFQELFKVAADFDEDIDITPNNSLQFAQLLKNLAKRHKLKPLTKEAVAAVHDFGTRLSGDSKKVSTHVRKLTDLLREADYYAMRLNEPTISESSVEKAISQQIFRASRVREQQYEHFARGILMVDLSGQKVGQINGLSFLELGGFAFGQPVRITASVGLGNGKIIDIEREIKLGGPIHSKGVLILTGYIHEHYAKDEVISLAASLVFEQSYGGVEGDSATVAEACALLSAIGGIPLKQSLAITGSMNQHGRVQPVGGVNEKIEGFFDICRGQGLTGEQGVIIPFANIDHLMLRKDVVEACEQGQFLIYAVKTIDDALGLLTGMEAGSRDRHGKFPPSSVNTQIEIALRAFAKKALKGRKPKSESI